jgi:hypothetical protein
MPNPAAAIRVVGREIAASAASGQNPNSPEDPAWSENLAYAEAPWTGTGRSHS